jgi:hypothetical protein
VLAHASSSVSSCWSPAAEPVFNGWRPTRVVYSPGIPTPVTPGWGAASSYWRLRSGLPAPAQPGLGSQYLHQSMEVALCATIRNMELLD